MKSMSPMPRSLSAPIVSMMIRESTLDGTRKAMRQEKLFLIVPVMTSMDGRWVARTRWMPTARASWASRPMA